MGTIFSLDHELLIKLILQLINTAILTGGLGFILYKPVKKFMQDRADKIKNQLETAESDMTEASQLKSDLAARLSSIGQERVEILEAAKKQAEEKSRQIIEEARAEAELIKNRAMMDIAHEQDRVKDEMKHQVINLSTMLAGRYVAMTIDAETQHKLLNEAIADLGDGSWLG